MRIRSVQEVDLSPFQWGLRAGSRILRVGLHATHVAREDDIVLQRAVATIVAFAGRRTYRQRRKRSKRKAPHVCCGECAWMSMIVTRKFLYAGICATYLVQPLRDEMPGREAGLTCGSSLEGTISIPKLRDKTGQKAYARWSQWVHLPDPCLAPVASAHAVQRPGRHCCLHPNRYKFSSPKLRRQPSSLEN
jgi:hypothetical protein